MCVFSIRPQQNNIQFQAVSWQGGRLGSWKTGCFLKYLSQKKRKKVEAAMVSLQNSQGEAATQHNPATPSQDWTAPEQRVTYDGTHPALNVKQATVGSLMPTLLRLCQVGVFHAV